MGKLIMQYITFIAYANLARYAAHTNSIGYLWFGVVISFFMLVFWCPLVPYNNNSNTEDNNDK
jgi:hypothetical protein